MLHSVFAAAQFLVGDQYDYHLEAGKTLKAFNIEQQGDIVRDYYAALNFGDAQKINTFKLVLGNFPEGY